MAICVAAGYTREEAAAALKIDVTDFNSMVKPEDVRTALKDLPNAVVNAADQKVMKDLLQGNVSSTTDIADRISQRRKKLLLDLYDANTGVRKDSKALEEKREDELKRRFGVDRQKGEVIDVKTEEKTENT